MTDAIRDSAAKRFEYEIAYVADRKTVEEQCEALNKLGAEGWELVSETRIRSMSDEWRWVLKREVRDA
jgi:hypothetical protein